MEKKVAASAEEVKIDKGIPLPSPRQKYPFDKMKVGESFFSVKNSVVNLSSKHNKSGKAKFTCRKVKDGYRVWRRV